ncbi:ABC transporter permease [Cognaticolwellia mytili]|uniref:ABC transporter permease n=1 Tax=Cognaticolwellia mytili TaxID=1888913 RepID=UPI000A178265|nr:ABC transporter permease [Cognaticolwellia mytili]
MNDNLQVLSLVDLAIAFIPVIVALFFIYLWSLNIKQAGYALARMLVQLLLIGYVLSYIFYSDSPWLIGIILLSMVSISSWIALRTLEKYRIILIKHGFIAILLGGGFTLLVISQGALGLTPWYQPQVIIPLAGMIFANAMNSVSLSAERIFSELSSQLPPKLSKTTTYQSARNNALNAATIPVINSLFAVGLVSLPGMMTGQILSGVSPLIAARYQIIVMCMIFASAILSAVVFLLLSEKDITNIIKKQSD